MGCLTTASPRAGEWFGSRPSWRLPVERDAMRYYGSLLTVNQTANTLTYIHAGLRVSGRRELVPVAVEFYANPPYKTYGLDPADYPRVFADRGAASKHRMPDDSLCLYYADDPANRRWTSDQGLLNLLDLTGDHLFLEDYWRTTGGVHKGQWLGPEAPHGVAP
nr:hypothetical protein pA19BH1_p06 [Arthrobacter sp.]